MDLLVCHSCNQLTPRSKMKLMCIDELEHGENEIIDSLIEGFNLADTIQFCKLYCWPNIIDSVAPKFSKLNNLKLDNPPVEIKCLNIYETILIQLAKSFQTIIRLSPAKKTRFVTGIPALKGILNNITKTQLTNKDKNCFGVGK